MTAKDDTHPGSGRAGLLLHTPYVLLAVGLFSLFVFQNDRNSFQQGHHGFLSSHGMAIASNLSREHRLLMFERMVREPSGDITYEPYSRFPIGSFAAIRLATLPFTDNLSMQIAVARRLMLCFFVAAAGLACLSLTRIIGCRWVATTATLTAFSSYLCLHYNDMIFNDIPSLFGVMLTFHGMVVFAQEGRFRQLVIKTCVALLLGWQVYALLLPFIVLHCVRVLRETRSLRAVLNARPVYLGCIAVLWGMAVLVFNLTSEYLAMGLPFGELPSVRQMMWRLGLGPTISYERPYTVSQSGWLPFVSNQLAWTGKMFIPFALFRHEEFPRLLAMLGGVLLVLAAVGAVVWKAVASRRDLLLTLVLSGLCWALPMRYFVAFHDFQSLYFIGAPLVFFAMLVVSLQRFSKQLAVWLAGVALLLFVVSVLSANRVKADGADATNRLTADFQAIADHVGQARTIYVDGDYNHIGGGWHAAGFYLAGNYFQEHLDNPDYVISHRWLEDATASVVGNARVFLYRGTRPMPTMTPDAEP